MSNVHERTIAAPAARIGALLDTLSSADDKFWPHENWPGVNASPETRSRSGGPRA